MRRVLAARPAELAEFQPARRGLFVFGRGVIAILAITALQSNNLSRHLSFPFVCLADEPRGLVHVKAWKSAKFRSPRIVPPLSGPPWLTAQSSRLTAAFTR